MRRLLLLLLALLLAGGAGVRTADTPLARPVLASLVVLS